MTISKAVKQPTSVGLEPALVRCLDVAAKKEGRSRAWVMRLALQQYFDREGITDPQAPDTGRGSDAGPATQRKRRTGR